MLSLQALSKSGRVQAWRKIGKRVSDVMISSYFLSFPPLDRRSSRSGALPVESTILLDYLREALPIAR